MSFVLVLLARQSDPARAAPDDRGGAQIEGEVTLGFRFVDVDGNHAQYDEDVNLDEGLYLRSARVRLSGLEGLPVESLELEAEGLGDPWAGLRLDALSGPWRTRAGFQRQRFVGNATADQHPFDIERERTRIDVDYRPRDGDTHSSLAFELLRRDGLYTGSRSVNLDLDFVEGFPARRQETTRTIEAGFGTRAGAWALDLDLGLDTLDSTDRLDFTLPAPDFPSDTVSEDFSADTQGVGQRGRVSLARELAEKTRLTLAMDWHTTGLSGDELSVQDGFFFVPSSPFVRTTSGDLTFDRRELAASAEVSMPVSSATGLVLGYERRHERGDGEVAHMIQLDELTGDPPSVSTTLDETNDESVLDRLHVDTSTEFSASRLDLSLEYGREQLDVLQVGDGVVVRSFDGTLNELGGEAGASFELAHAVTLDLGVGHHLRPTETAEAGVAYDFRDDRETFARAGCHRRGERQSFGGELRLEHRSSEALTSESDVARLSLDYAGTIGELTRLETVASVATHDLDSDTTFLFLDPSGIQEVPATATFEARDVAFSGSLTRDLSELHPRLEWSLSLGRGDAVFDYYTAGVVLPWNLREGYELGLAARALDFDGADALDDSDYHALVLELYVSRSFAPRSL